MGKDSCDHRQENESDPADTIRALRDRSDRVRWNAAATRFVKEHLSHVERAVRSVLHHNDIEDEVLEALYLAIKKIEELADPANVNGWLWTLTRNKVLRMHERHRSVDVVTETDLGVRSQQFPDVMEGEDDPRLEALSEAIDTLPQETKAILEKHYVEGKTFEQIGDELGKPEATITTIENRARSKLRGTITRRVSL